MPKTLVAHNNPDLDAIMPCWLLIRFDQSRFGDAQIEFVPASTTYRNEPVDSDPEVVHVDVGLGKFDHHQPGVSGTCASKLVWEYLVEQNLISPSDKYLKLMVDHTLAIDHFQDCYWPEGQEPRFAFTLSEIIPALHRLQIYGNEAVVRMVFAYLDAVYQRLKDWGKSQEAIAAGEVFTSVWGKSVLAETGADDVSKVAQRMGFDLVVVHDPAKGYIKIKLRPGAKRNLQAIYAKIHAIEPDKWYFHNSGLMLFSGSDKGAEKEPTRLTPGEVVKMIQAIK